VETRQTVHMNPRKGIDMDHNPPAPPAAATQPGDSDPSMGTVRQDPQRGSFAMMPEQLLEDPRLSDRAVRLWGLLVGDAREPGPVTFDLLTSKLRCSVDDVQSALNELAGAGWVTP
jgi:hypothetical protein